MKKKILPLTLSLIMFFFTGLANLIWAEYPEKKIRFIVPNAPGGGADLTARILTKFANPYLNNKLYVENIAGAACAIGSRACLQADPDGYTLITLLTNHTLLQYTTKDYPSYEFFDPICIVAMDPVMISVRYNSPLKTFGDLVSHAKANPGKLSASNAGVGTPPHLGIAAIEGLTGIELTHVPFPGSGPAMTAAMGGHTDLGGLGCSEALPYVQGHKLRPLIVLSNDRSQLYPDVLVPKELGYDLAVYMFRGVAVRKGTPKEVKEVLASAFKKAMDAQECRKLMDKYGLEITFLNPEEAGPWLKKRSELHRNLVTRLGLHP